MDLVAERGGFTHELVMLNMVQPHGNFKFLVSRLRAFDLKVLVLGFVSVALSCCSGFLGWRPSFWFSVDDVRDWTCP
jgi:hypothetical protein